VHRLAGLGVFCSPNLAMTVDLPRQVPEMVMVADSFHVKPSSAASDDGPYQVLCLTRKDVRLFEGTEHRSERWR